jgi:hypothetical protein
MSHSCDTLWAVAKQTNHVTVRLSDAGLAAIDQVTDSNPRMRSEAIRFLLTEAYRNDNIRAKATRHFKAKAAEL